MNRLFYIASILLLFLQSCTKDFGDNSSMDMGEPVRLTFNIDRVESGLLRSERQSKAPIPLDIKSLEVWVFDHNGIFRECAQATLLGPDSDGKKTYSVVLHSSDQSCRVHFVANYSIFHKFDSEFKGRTEASVFSSIRLNKDDIKDSIVPMWGYVKDVVINQNTKFSNDNGGVRLIPSVSFISLSIDPSLATQLKPLGYVLYNSCQEGLLAGYSKLLTNNTLDFAGSDVTPVTQSIRSTIPSESGFVSIDTPLIVFEQDNHVNDPSRIPYLILKAEVEGKIKYIKLDLVNMFYGSDGQLNYSRYDVKRNVALDIYINKSIGLLSELPDNIKGAIQSLPANNTALSMDHLSSPVIDDGNARLKVERVYYVLRKQNNFEHGPNGHLYKLRFTAQYFPDKSKDLDNIDESAVQNGDISCVIVRSDKPVIRDCFVIPDPNTHKANIYIDYDNNVGGEESILVYVKNQPGLVRKITFKVVDNLYLDAKLNPKPSRSVMLPDPNYNPTAYDGYKKEYEGETKYEKQFLDVGSPFELEVGFPPNFPKSVLPIDLLVYTDKLVPSDNFMLYELVPNTNMKTNICFRTKIYSFDGDLFETNERGEHIMRMKFLTSKYLDYDLYKEKKYYLQIQTSPRNIFENFSPNLQPDDPSAPTSVNENDYCLFVNFGYQVAPLKN